MIHKVNSNHNIILTKIDEDDISLSAKTGHVFDCLKSSKPIQAEGDAVYDDCICGKDECQLCSYDY